MSLRDERKFFRFSFTNAYTYYFIRVIALLYELILKVSDPAGVIPPMDKTTDVVRMVDVGTCVLFPYNIEGFLQRTDNSMLPTRTFL